MWCPLVPIHTNYPSFQSYSLLLVGNLAPIITHKKIIHFEHFPLQVSKYFHKRNKNIPLLYFKLYKYTKPQYLMILTGNETTTCIQSFIGVRSLCLTVNSLGYEQRHGLLASSGPGPLIPIWPLSTLPLEWDLSRTKANTHY